jgi:hypothetical protein
MASTELELDLAELLDNEEYPAVARVLSQLPAVNLKAEDLTRWSELLSQVALRVPQQLSNYLVALPPLYRQYLLDETILELVKSADYLMADYTDPAKGSYQADLAIRNGLELIVKAGGEVFNTVALETAVVNQLYCTVAYLMSLVDTLQDDVMEHVEAALMIVADSKSSSDQDLLESLWLVVDEDSAVKYDAEDLIRRNGVLRRIG